MTQMGRAGNHEGAADWWIAGAVDGWRPERVSRGGMVPCARIGRGKQVHNLRYGRLPTGATGLRARRTKE